MKSIINFLKRFFLRFGYWLYTILTPFVLVLFEEYDTFFSLSLLIYSLILVAWSVVWIVGQRKTLMQLRKEKNQTELQHLKSQVNPHFFFNTLNNLYGLIDIDSAKAKSMVLKLSDMMRYSIYDGQKEFVTLEEELHYLQDYIELHKARYHKSIEVNLQHHLAPNSMKVMPLLFIILLENAFKHGVESLRSEAFVNVYLSGSESNVVFSVENNFDVEQVSNNTGIGLSNLKRRLELSYPNRHTFTVLHEENIFKVQLTLSTI